MRVHHNAALDAGRVPAARDVALEFHRSHPDYASTPLHDLPGLASTLGVTRVLAKDETSRMGLPAFKIVGASWAVEAAIRRAPRTTTLVAASAGNHGRAVAHVAAQRGLRCRIHLPERASAVRRDAIAAEGAEIVPAVGGDYDDAVRAAARDALAPGAQLVADVGSSTSAHDVIDGYATLFAELTDQLDDPRDTVLVVPVGVGSLGAAAARWGARSGATIVAAEPSSAACLGASLVAGAPTAVRTPGTSMAGMDCASVSPAAWPSLKHGIAAAVEVHDEEIPAATAALGAHGLTVGECAAATWVAANRLRHALPVASGAGAPSTIALLLTEGPTGARSERGTAVAR